MVAGVPIILTHAARLLVIHLTRRSAYACNYRLLPVYSPILRGVLVVQLASGSCSVNVHKHATISALHCRTCWKYSFRRKLTDSIL